MATLFGPDVEDYRRLPSRPMANSPGAVPMPQMRDPNWMRPLALAPAGRSLADPAAFDAFQADHATHAFIVVANGQVVDERYYNGYQRESLCKSFSISSRYCRRCMGIAAAEGLIALDDRLGAHVPAIANPQLAAVTIEQLLDNVSGFAYEKGNAPLKQQPRMYYSTDVRGYLLRTSVARAPGSVFAAEELSPLLLGFALESALRRKQRAATLADYATQVLWQPMGAEFDALWNLDREADGLEKVESGLVARAIDLARFGQVYLDGGLAHGRQVLPAAWVAASTSAPEQGRPNRFTDGFHRKLWWGLRRAGRQRDDFYANGHFGQRVYVSPDKALVLVRLGSDSANIDWTAMLADIADRWPSPDRGATLPTSIVN